MWEIFPIALVLPEENHPGLDSKAEAGRRVRVIANSCTTAKSAPKALGFERVHGQRNCLSETIRSIKVSHG